MWQTLVVVKDWFTGDDVRKRRALIRSEPFPDSWREILMEDVEFYRHLDGEPLQRFEERLKVFVSEKHFEGAGGMEIDERIRLVIAAAASRLVLYLDDSYYDRLRDIVVYPDAVVLPPDGSGTQDGSMLAAGVAFDGTTVILSWKATLQGLRNATDGRDTATHEFAHILD